MKSKLTNLINSEEFKIILYFLFYALISANGLVLVEFFFLFTLSVGFQSFGLNEPRFLQTLIFLFQRGSIPFILLIISYQAIKKLHNVNHFFITTFTILAISYSLEFWGVFSYGYSYTLFIAAYVAILSYSLTMLWNSIVLSKENEVTFLLFPPFLLGFVTLFFGLRFLLALYVPLGEYLNKLTQYQFNIFYFDFSGFVLLFSNLVFCLLALLLSYLLKKSKKGKIYEN